MNLNIDIKMLGLHFNIIEINKNYQLFFRANK
jgi:hypothetical protein